jgi:hypothetical protein
MLARVRTEPIRSVDKNAPMDEHIHALNFKPFDWVGRCICLSVRSLIQFNMVLDQRLVTVCPFVIGSQWAGKPIDVISVLSCVLGHNIQNVQP